MKLKLVEDTNDNIIVIKEAKCKTSTNGNYNLYNVFAGDVLKYEVLKPFELYRVYRKYDEVNPVNSMYSDLDYVQFRTHFKPLKGVYT